MIQKFRKKEEILAVLYDGSPESVDAIREMIKDKKGFSVGIEETSEELVTNEDRTLSRVENKERVVALIYEEPPYTTSNFLYVGDYAIFDISNEFNPFFAAGEDYINKYYTKLEN